MIYIYIYIYIYILYIYIIICISITKYIIYEILIFYYDKLIAKLALIIATIMRFFILM